MIRTLTLIDFMAHSRTVLDLGPGLNVLCGPNNTGKSAVVEALRCLCTNPTPRHVIRHGASEARVEALLDDGSLVAWVRRKAYALYEVTAPGGQTETYAKLGRGKVPEDVSKLLRLGPVGTEKGDEVDVHLGDQRHPIFLLDRPGSAMADFLASSTESAHLMAMQDLLRDKVRRAKLARKAKGETLDRTRARLDRLTPLPALTLGVENLEAALDDLESRLRAEPELARLAGRLRLAARTKAGLTERLDRLSVLSVPPTVRPARELARHVAALDGLVRRLGNARRTLETLAPLSVPPALAPAAGLSDHLARGRAVTARVTAQTRRLGVLAGLTEPPVLAEPTELAKILGGMAELSARLDKGRQVVARQKRELEALASRVKERLAEVGQCPLCGNDLEARLFLGEVSRGDSA
ncbi:hypothetical protein JCM15519_29620 [Fundidesulfovibrio butyratiphilus]